jgi:hypothetical protein
MRKILRRMTETAVTAEEAAKRVDAEEGVTLLDERPSSLLVEGEPEALSAIAKTLCGWCLLDVDRISRPDTRVRVKRPPREDE